MFLLTFTQAIVTNFVPVRLILSGIERDRHHRCVARGQGTAPEIWAATLHGVVFPFFVCVLDLFL
ncbi:hypothetical protein IVA80_11110 [Bradyrhizobium sp. 139]|uniref:hypothetical protein n=1 Tax=Bradyrhizobium sp. 139 TaxID=2782616 RepID=UPI001FF895B0|nr:hypothetical protein [Bradyrhizobium sp. 139]MCK1741400.1 hypothetical protein [Bradyrhizobium sp. 139]